MNLSVRKKWGAVHVRGGRVLAVTHDHQISASTYDARVDDSVTVPETALQAGALPHKKRDFSAKWTTAKIGDLAVEIVVPKTAKVIGYGYLSGDAINTIRYVADSERARVAAWFSPGRGVRFTVSTELELEQFVASVMGVKYSGNDLACSRLELQDEGHMNAALNGFLSAYAYEAEGLVPTTHMLVTVCVRKQKAYGTVHCQPTKHAQDYAAQPFFHELLQTSPDLVSHEFLPLPPKKGPMSDDMKYQLQGERHG